MPNGWDGVQNLDTLPQFHCACTNDGKVFVFGGPFQLAQFDFQTLQWTQPTPTFTNSTMLSANYLNNQRGIRAALNPDGYTISIITSSPPAYMEFDSKAISFQGRPVNIPADMHGMCMTIVPKTGQAVVCGGSINNVYNGNCYALSVTTGATILGELAVPQDGCTMLPYMNGFVFVPGYPQYYHTGAGGPDSSRNPSMRYFNAQTKTWTNLTGLDAGMFSLRVYLQATIMPGYSNISVFYGGQTPDTISLQDLSFADLGGQRWLTELNPLPAFNIPLSPGAPTLPSATTSPSVLPTGGSKSNADDSNDGKMSAIVGGTVGGVSVVAISGILAFLLVRKRNSAKDPPISGPGVGHQQMPFIPPPPTKPGFKGFLAWNPHGQTQDFNYNTSNQLQGNDSSARHTVQEYHPSQTSLGDISAGNSSEMVTGKTPETGQTLWSSSRLGTVQDHSQMKDTLFDLSPPRNPHQNGIGGGLL
ncbi:hypothetical protein BGW38_006480 [Lunasporangiospora selenospora]|uniref:Uncharacterized protein n=1 Tax=Lunasporangiospora selenospora TaxID=979761 RepID=A0A9P6FNN5_9FUNG|nr:hypothetical protein BGW38_006480 [Lunasporangiospora selenospora]